MNALHLIAIAALVLLLAIDCLQTMTIATHPTAWRERNPLLRGLIGLCDSFAARKAIVVGYFALVAALAVGSGEFLYEFDGVGLSFFYLAVLLVVEVVCVTNNFVEGIEPFDASTF